MTMDFNTKAAREAARKYFDDNKRIAIIKAQMLADIAVEIIKKEPISVNAEYIANTARTIVELCFGEREGQND